MCFNECSKLIKIDNTLSKQDNFFQFVYNKISKDTKKRSILKGENFIDILPFEKIGTRVIPSFKDINTNTLYQLKNEIKIAFDTICLNNGQIAQVYIACPRNKKFNKQIEIKIPDLEELYKNQYKIKIVPYSLRSISSNNK